MVAGFDDRLFIILTCILDVRRLCYTMTNVLYSLKKLATQLSVFLLWLKGSLKKKKKNRHSAELRRAYSATKVHGPYFPTQCPKWSFIIPIVLVEHTKLIYHMPWLYQ